MTGNPSKDQGQAQSQAQGQGQGDSDLSEYTVDVDGIEHTMMLSEEDAKRYGDKAKRSSGKSGGAADKSRATPPNKGV